MAIAPLFDASNWIRSNLRGGPKLDASSEGAFAGLSVMYCLFECIACDGYASLASIRKVADQVKGARPSRVAAYRLNAFISFWRERFDSRRAAIIPNEPLPLADNSLPLTVKRVFETRTARLSDKVLVLILCARFVKSHVLYQAKSIAALDEQLENMDVAAQSIAVVLTLVRPHLYLR